MSGDAPESHRALHAPSGDQIHLRRGEQTATLVSVGAGVRTYTVRGHDAVDGYAVTAMADGARGQTLIPWPNRVRDGKWSWQGERMQLALTEPDQYNAIHGLVRWLGWTVLEQSEEHVAFRCTSWPQMGYPWALDIQVRYTLTDTGLAVRQTIRNCGQSPAPVAAGAHPYLTVNTTTIDEAILHLPAMSWLPTDDQQIPTGTAGVEGTAFDFRTPRPVGDSRIDYTYTDLERDVGGRFVVSLQHPEEPRQVQLWMDESYGYVEVFTGDTLPDPTRRRRGLGIEPMTAPPNALDTKKALRILQADEEWAGEWGITALPA